MKLTQYFLMIAITCGCMRIPALAQENATAGMSISPYKTGFDPQHIIEVRDLVKRVRWNELSIDTQLKQTQSNNDTHPIRTETVKAALLGETELILSAFSDINTALQIHPETQTGQVWFQTLQTYDCLRSIPESKLMSQGIVHEAMQSMQNYAELLYAIVPKQDDPYEIATHQAACAYAAVITKNDEQVRKWLNGNQNGAQTVKPLWKTLSEAVPNEGTGNRDKVLDGYLFALYSVLRGQSGEEFDTLKPWMTRSVETLNRFLQMIQLNGVEAILDDTNRYWHLSALERYYKNDSNQTSGAILNKLYDAIPRRADMLLFGKVPWVAPQGGNIQSASSTIIPRMGIAYLQDNKHGVPVSLLLQTGSHAPQLTISPTMFLTNENRTVFEQNTVLVDQKWNSQHSLNAPNNALITSFVSFDDQGVFASASASGRYGERAVYSKDDPDLTFPVSFYQRDLYVDSPYIIDWFRVTGGGMQDYIYELPGSLQVEQNLEWKTITPAQNSYRFMQQANSLQSTQTNGVFAVTSKPNNSGLAERVWFVDYSGSELIHAQQEKNDVIISRKTFSDPTANLFAVVHEVAKNEFNSEIKIERLSLNPQPNESGFQAMAFVIKNGAKEDIFYSSLQPNQTYTTHYNGLDIEFHSTFAHIQLLEGMFSQMRMVRGTHLKMGDYALEFDEAMTTGVINAIDEKTASFDLSFPYLLPFGDALKHHVLYAVSTEPNTPFLQPLVFSHADDLKKLQRYHLQYLTNLSNPPATLAAPLKNGDQVLFESFAELKQNTEDSFNIYHSSPVRFTIPATETKKRVFVNETKVQRLRGDYKDGLIHASITPLESYDAAVEVIRVP